MIDERGRKSAGAEFMKVEIEGHLYVVFGVVSLMGGEVEGGGRMFAKEGGWGEEIERYVS